jgi:hypothetical protein
MKDTESKENKRNEENTVPGPHKPNIEDEKPGQSAVGKHSKTQREQNEERDQHNAR